MLGNIEEKVFDVSATPFETRIDGVSVIMIVSSKKPKRKQAVGSLSASGKTTERSAAMV